MSVSIDDDTLAAFRALWQASEGLPELFDRPPEAGRLKADLTRARPLPYAQIASRALRAERYSAHGVKDVRQVTITLWGTYAQAAAALAAVQAVFNPRMGAPDRPVLAYPSEATFVALRHPSGGEGTLEQDETTRAGQDVWRAVLACEVTSGRDE